MAKKKLSLMLTELHDMTEIIEKLDEKADIISKDYSKLDSPFEILNTYLKVLVSILPLVEKVAKGRTSEFSIRALTMLGDSIRQTITDLEIYKDPEIIMEEKITPHIQFHHDEVIKKISLQLARLKENIMEFIAVDKQKSANTLLIEFITKLGDELRKTYNLTLDKIREDISSVRGL